MRIEAKPSSPPSLAPFRARDRLATLVTALSLAAGAALLGGCARSAQADGKAEKVAAPSGRKAETTPAVIEKAESLLKQNPDAAIGSEYPFELDGRRYVGRVEEHDNPSGEPGRPQGKHRGITVYEAD